MCVCVRIRVGACLSECLKAHRANLACACDVLCLDGWVWDMYLYLGCECVYLRMSVCLCVCGTKCLYVCVCMRALVCACVCMFACVFTCAYMCCV